MLLPTPAAHAGSWTYAITGDNTGSTFTDNGVNVGAPAYSPAASGSGSIAGTYAYTVNRANNGPSGSGCSIHLVVHAQVTFTWHPASGQTMTTDPPPPSVVIQESSTSFWSASSGDTMHAGSVSGSVANGLSDPEYDPSSMQTAYSGVGYSGPPPNQSYPAPVPALVSHFTTYPASSGTVTVASRTLTATATAVASSWYYGAKAIAGSYSASIHAQPYNFHQTNVTDNGDGTLQFTYFWLSTNGNLGDLDPNCVVHEYVTYPGSGSNYVPPDPFIVTAYPYGLSNPTITPIPKRPGSTGYLTDNQLFRGSSPLDVIQPYQLAYFSGTQTYEFDDSATGETNKQIPGPDSGPLSIDRTIGPRPPYVPYWWYSVTKNGTTAWTPLPNQ
jgi:hypothetical protein